MSTHATTSMRLEAERGFRRSGLLAWLRSFARMWWLDVKGSQGIFVLPLMVGLGLFGPANLFEEEVVLWKMMNFASVQAYTFIAPVTAGLAAWTASRDRRRRMEGLLDSTARSPVTRDISVFAATAGWGVLGYGIVAACFSILALARATWGGFDANLVLTGALGVVLAAAVGVLIGSHVPGRYAALLAVAVTYAVAFMGDVLGTVGLFVNEPLLSPMQFAWRVGQSPYWGVQDDHVNDGVLWLAGLTGVALALIVLVRRMTLPGLVALVASVAIAVMGVMPLLGAADDYRDRQVVPYEATCDARMGVEVCVHPAYAARLPANLAIVSGMVSPLMGLEGVRTHWEQGLGSTEMGLGGPDIQLYDLRGNAAARTVADEVLPVVMSRESDLTRPASQLVILYWLAEQAGLGHPATWETEARWNSTPQWPFGYPADVPQRRVVLENGAYWFEVDEAALAVSGLEIDAAVDRFAALTAADQRAWLEANWEALRAGEITLDELL